MHHQVNLKDFLDQVEGFCHTADGKGLKQYDEAARHRDFWDNLGYVEETDVENHVLSFLNKWECRIPYSCKQELACALREAEQWIAPLRREDLSTIRLCGHMEETGDESEYINLIHEAFQRIANVDAGRRSVGPTAASKILHLAAPKLFVMWDEAIRVHYGYYGNSAGYCSFMIRMNILTGDLYNQALASGTDLASILRSRRVTFPRMLDMYNLHIIDHARTSAT